jgi:YHS domain-containing protein
MSKTPIWQSAARLDPVCGKRLANHAGIGRSSEYKHRTYYFCSDACQQTFHKETAGMGTRLFELARAGGLLNPRGVHWGLS